MSANTRNRKTQTPRGAFGSTVHALASELSVKVAFVCEALGDDRAQTLALFVDGQFLENLTYRLSGTPCALVCEKGVAFYTKDVAQIYPEDRILSEWQIDSYMGVAFSDTQGNLMGHVGVMNDGPLEDPTRVETRLRSAAVELGAQMESRRASAPTKT